jgi:ribosomal protein S18 acetylase RimI-like enzyme
MTTTISGKMRPLDIRRDLDGLGELIEIAFAGELARRGGDLRAELRLAQRMVPLILVLSQVSEGFRHVLDGFVWEDRGRIVASVTVQGMGDDRMRWYIGSVATHPDYRRRGLARLLVTRAMEHARAHGAEVCILDVRADNLPAYKLYLSLGYLHYDSTTELKLEELPLVQAKHRREPSRAVDGGERCPTAGDWLSNVGSKGRKASAPSQTESHVEQVAADEYIRRIAKAKMRMYVSSWRTCLSFGFAQDRLLAKSPALRAGGRPQKGESAQSQDSGLGAVLQRLCRQESV